MANTPIVPMGDDVGSSGAVDKSIPNAAAYEAAQNAPRPWQRGAALSSIAGLTFDRIEQFLANAGFDRAPWIAVCFACGIFAWFGLSSPWQWTSAIGLGILLCLAAMAAWRGDDTREHCRTAAITIGLVFAAGIVVIWARSEMVGAEPIERPAVERVQGYVLERQDQPADDRIRLTMAVRDAATGESRKIRVNVPFEEVSRIDGQEGEEALG
ncbi:DUF4131 domain-containing protein [Erythrobacter sp. YT30]|uniref:DUF4131 domain-containing protein n=1 Tax=Erythrobacter sp. YT30 TaxID=1735012 RepID=UPI000A8BE4B2|nr:DUF4131 domain-containing protein [Erythrobacter sp. YT30]